jgi:hypothetical protein
MDGIGGALEEGEPPSIILSADPTVDQTHSCSPAPAKHLHPAAQLSLIIDQLCFTRSVRRWTSREYLCVTILPPCARTHSLTTSSLAQSQRE